MKDDLIRWLPVKTDFYKPDKGTIVLIGRGRSKNTYSINFHINTHLLSWSIGYKRSSRIGGEARILPHRYATQLEAEVRAMIMEYKGVTAL